MGEIDYISNSIINSRNKDIELFLWLLIEPYVNSVICTCCTNDVLKEDLKQDAFVWFVERLRAYNLNRGNAKEINISKHINQQQKVLADGSIIKYENFTNSNPIKRNFLGYIKRYIKRFIFKRYKEYVGIVDTEDITCYEEIVLKKIDGTTPSPEITTSAHELALKIVEITSSIDKAALVIESLAFNTPLNQIKYVSPLSKKETSPQYKLELIKNILNKLRNYLT